MNNIIKDSYLKIFKHYSLLFLFVFKFILPSHGETWYTLVSGDWEDPAIWTLDPSGALPDNPNNYTPTTSPTSTTDDVVILTGRTVTIQPGNDNKTNAILTIKGRLDFTTTTGHTFSEIRGGGKILLSADNFPAGDSTHFVTAGQGEGTVIYNGASYNLTNVRTFFNLEIDLDDPANMLTLLADYQVNGSLTVTNGGLQINDNSSTTRLNLTVDGNVLVTDDGAISVGTADAYSAAAAAGYGNFYKGYHIFTVDGNFTNYGNIRLTNQAVPDYQTRTTTGAVSLVFTGAQNNTFQCYDTTDLYILVVNKGTDQTYELALYAQDISYFGLFCTNDDAMDSTVPGHPENRKALWIQAGTLRLTGELLIPSLTEGGNDWAIGENAKFILDGENVEVYSTTTTAFDFSGLSYSTPNGIRDATSNQGTYLFGDFIINNGFYSSSNSSGMCYRDEAAGNLQIEGGEISLTQLRISGFASTGYYSYIQTDGIMRIRGTGEIKHLDPIFGLVDPDMTFTMTGGQLIIDQTSNAGAIRIESTSDKIYVSGGELIIDYNNTSTIYSTAPFYNVDILTGSNVDLLYPFTILNDFTLGSGITFDHDGFNVTIGGDFTINTGATYVYNAGDPNTTTINGNDDSQLAFYNISGSSEQFFWRMVIDKPQDKVVSLASSKTGLDLEGTSNVLLHIDGDAFILQSGILDQGFHSVRFNIDTLINYGTLGVYDPASATPDATSNGNNDLIYFNSDPFEMFTIDNSQFGNVRLSSEDQIITLNSDVYMQRLDWGHGRIFLNTHNLKLDELYVNLDPAETVGGQPSVEDMFITSENASDGGLTIYIPATGIDPTEGDNVFEFPVGIGTDGIDFTLGGNSKYTPCLLTISNVTDDGYITINPVDTILPTTSQSGNILSYYWRVRQNDFSAIPTVSLYQYFYYEDDVDGADDNLFVPGKVLDESPYTRSSEDLADLDAANNIINFDGSGSGFTLENANYTAGENARFTGQVLIYYTRDHGADIGIAAREPRWRDRETWTRSDLLIDANGDGPIDEKDWHDSRQPAIPAGDPDGEWPTAGHVVVIGWVPWDDPKVALRGQPHGVWADNNMESCAEVMFTQMKDIGGNPVPRYYRSNFQFRPTLCINETNGNLNAGLVRGEGMFWNRWSDPNLNLMDLGEFVDEDSAYIVYESRANPNTLNNTPSNAPNIIVATDGWAANNKDLTIANDITTNGNFEIMGNTNLVMGNGATGDITVLEDLKMVEFDGDESPPSGGGAELAFRNNGTSRTITVHRDVIMNNTGSIIHVRAPDVGIVDHYINVYGDILQNSAGAGTDGMQLFTALTQDRITLSLLGDSNMSFDLTSGDTPELYRLVVNKGSDQSVTATINCDFNLGGATDGIGTPKALELQNGTLILDNSGIDIDLTTGDDDFVIPGTAALEVSDGEVNVSGDNSGIYLDGKLIISGGTVDMYDLAGNGNNYIEYSASGDAEIEIISGSLSVGSQIRRSPTIDIANLKYTQSGGTVNVGMAAAPVNNRGVFEILGLGSEFTFTGGELLISRQQTSPTIASLYLNPETHSIASSSVLRIGSNLTPVNQDIGIYSVIPVKNLIVDNSSGNDPVAQLWSLPLTVEEDLTIQAGSEFDANGYQLTISGNLTNNGTYTPNGNTTLFNGTGNQTITGNTTFYNLTKSTANTLSLAAGNAEIIVQNVLAFQDGTLRDSSNTVYVQGYCLFDGTHIHTGAGDGIELSGALQQELTGDGIFGKLTIDNNYGIIVPPGNEFAITDTLKMDGGLFDVGKNLLKLGLNASIEEATPFSANNMIQTNISFTDNGVQKTFPAGASTFIYPMGSGGKYTPVTFTITANGNNTGNITVKPANEMHPSIIEDLENPDPEIVDSSNVLQYHWLLKANGISGFSATAEMKYEPSDVKVTAPYDVYDYITARLLSDGSGNWNLFDDVNTFDETNELLIFSFAGVGDNEISGDYTAGIAGSAFNGAIPDNVPLYETNSPGNWETGTIWTPNIAGGPRGSMVLINSIHTVTPTANGILVYSTEIEGTLRLNSTFGHRLGIVTGTGTIYVESDALAAGIYDEFFSASGGTLEYGGSTNYDVLGTIYQLNNLTFSGTGDRRLSDADILLYGDLTIDGAASLEVINDFNRELEIKGDFIRVNGIFEAGSGATASVLMSGVVNQNLTGDFTGTSALNILEIDNNNGATLGGDVYIEDQLVLTNGAITTSGNTLKVELNATVSPATASNTRYINGALTKELISGNDFNFPVGKNGNPGNIEVSDAGGYGGTGDWSAEYFFTNPTLDGYDVTLFASPVATVSQTEYWDVQAPAGGQGKLVITLDGSSDVANAASDLDSLLIVAWDGAQWVQVGGDPVISGTATSGTVTAETDIDFDTYSIFTLALEETVSVASASIISGDATICDGESTDILVALTGTAPWSVTYTDGVTPDTDNGIMASPHTITVSPSSNTTYTLTAATDGSGPANLVGDIDAFITVNSLPVITFTNNTVGDETCAGNTVIFTAGGGLNYNFHLNAGSVQDGGGTIYTTATLINNDEVYVVVTNVSGCSDTSSTTTMTVYQPPVANAGSDASICENSAYTVNDATVTNGDGTYSWGHDGNGILTNGTTLTPTYTADAADAGTTVTMTLTADGNADCGQDNDQMQIVVEADVVANAGSDASICENSAYTVNDAAVTNGDGTYSWGHDGNGILTNGTTLTPTYTADAADAGSIVTLTLTANSGGSCPPGNDAMEVTINPIPLTSNITGNGAPNCFAQGEVYSVVLTPGSKYYWSVPGSVVIVTDTSGVEQNSIEVNFGSISGNIRVYEVNQYGCLGGEVSLLIDLQGCNLDAEFTVDNDNICIEETITFTNASGGTSESTLYSWNFGDGAVPQTANTIGPHDVYYSTSGDKTISLTITQSLSDIEIKSDFVTVNPSPVATIDPAERCGEGEVTLNASGTNGDIIDFSLDGGTGVDFTDNTAPYQFTTSILENTTIEVWVRARSSITQCTGDWINSATAYSYPVPVTGEIIPDEPSGDENYIDIVCSGDDNAGYSVAEIEGSTFNWSVPALNFTAENSQQITVDWNISGGEYIISVQEISEYGCEGVVREETVLVSEPDASLEGDKEICAGESITVTTTTEFTRYLWYNGSTSPDITVSDEGLISVITWDEYDCISRDSVNVFVHELPTVNLGNDTVICGDNAIQVDAGDFVSYIWSTGHTSNPIIIYEGEKTVSVTVTDEHGCSESGSIYVNACIAERLFEDVTNAFTPNNDGVHDVWIINNISLFPDAKIEVFDRWGRLVFSKDGGYENDWDGTYNGKDLPMDTYYYVIDLKTGTEPLKGTLTIIR